MNEYLYELLDKLHVEATVMEGEKVVRWEDIERLAQQTCGKVGEIIWCENKSEEEPTVDIWITKIDQSTGVTDLAALRRLFPNKCLGVYKCEKEDVAWYKQQGFNWLENRLCK